MLNEYAVDPACLSDWQNFRFLIGGFGVSHGRLISQFPKDWAKRVYNVCENFSFVQRQKMEIELLRIKKCALARSGRSYDVSIEWIDNAIQQHANKQFAAIISNEIPHAPEFVLNVDDIAPHSPLWSIERERKIPRSAEDLASSLASLLRISNRILFIDRMFHPAAERWRDVLTQMIRITCNGQEQPPAFEYHCGIEPEEFGKPEEKRKSDFQEQCDRHLLKILPPKSSISITRWDRHHKGDFFHDRYVLTDKGGVRVGWGLDRGKLGETTDICLLDDTMYSQLWSSFQAESAIYKFIDTTTISSRI